VFPCLGLLAFAATGALYVSGARERQAPRRSAQRHSYAAVLLAPQLRSLLALVATEGFLFMGGFSYLSGLLEERFGLTALGIGFVLASTGASQLLTARLLPRLLRPWSERRLLACGGLVLGLAFLGSAVAPHWSPVALGCFLLGVGFILCHTTLQTRATEAFPNARGTAVALFAFSLFLGAGTGTAVLGALLDQLGFTRLFSLVGALLLVFTLVVVRVLGRRT
jgi:predicted MFS family arabinose efflux permease